MGSCRQNGCFYLKRRSLMHLFVSPLGLTGHTEVVRVVFSPKDVSLETLLKHFWERHDPTQGSNLYTHTQKKQMSPPNNTCPEGHKVY